MDCIVRAIETHLIAMPEDFRPAFEHAIRLLELRRRETEESLKVMASLSPPSSALRTPVKTAFPPQPRLLHSG